MTTQNENANLSVAQQILDQRFNRMNAMQKKAVFNINGPILILAGAGSGKTTVLVNRIAYMINFGNAYYENTPLNSDATSKLQQMANNNDYDVNELKEILDVNPIKPWNILAITFTNKAATELKARLVTMLGDAGDSVYAGTFHSICLRILRKEIDKIGYNSNFTIYDTDDAIRLVRDCTSELNIDDKMFPHKATLSAISRAKDSMLSPSEYIKENEHDFKNAEIGKIYKLYQERLRKFNAVDFDDIIALTVQLFMADEEVLNHYQNLFKYVLVDEYQDTNKVQYKLVNLLSRKSGNICVVGDDDQSIYKFRGATIENILNFEIDYKNALVIRLEQNYRSTQNILDVANAVISNNKGRKGKELWSDKGEGAKIIAYKCTDENNEAQFVVNKINESIKNGSKFADNCILYRMNAQSSNMERALVQSAIPYKIFGGTKFYERKEIKDILSYLHIIANNTDSIRLKRIINEPKRGIGEATIRSIETIAGNLDCSMMEVMRESNNYEVIYKKANLLINFIAMIDDIKQASNTMSFDNLIDYLLDRTGYKASLKAQGREGEGRLENIEELKTNLIRYEEANENATIGGFLEEIALYTDLDNMNDIDDRVTLMTMHSAKGLEFEHVYLIGMEENIFPSYLSSNSSEELEEERRLAYVALTRAKTTLCVINSAQRMLFGRTSRNMPSRFLDEIPTSLTEIIDETTKAYGYAGNKAEKAKPVYKPEIKGTVGVNKPKEISSVIYNIGDKVKHNAFGEGVVKSLTKMSNDTLIEVDFASAGTKKIMANFSKLEVLS